MKNKVLFMTTTLGLVLTVGVLTYSQQAFAVTMGGNGGNGGTGANGGTCTTSSCNLAGGSSNGGAGETVLMAVQAETAVMVEQVYLVT
jgi:hypothetical protein